MKRIASLFDQYDIKGLLDYDNKRNVETKIQSKRKRVHDSIEIDQLFDSIRKKPRF